MEKPIVLVEWIDSAMETEPWVDTDKGKTYQPSKCRSVGWVSDSNPTRMVLHSDDGDGQIGRVMVIPSDCIQKITHLEAKKPPRKKS